MRMCVCMGFIPAAPHPSPYSSLGGEAGCNVSALKSWKAGFPWAGIYLLPLSLTLSRGGKMEEALRWRPRVLTGNWLVLQDLQEGQHAFPSPHCRLLLISSGAICSRFLRSYSWPSLRFSSTGLENGWLCLGIFSSSQRNHMHNKSINMVYLLQPGFKFLTLHQFSVYYIILYFILIEG